MFLPSNITLKFGDSGDFVAELQRRLAMVQCFDETQVNAFYDGATVNGVMRFQGMNGLHADGIAGPETLRRLNGVIAGDTSGTTGSQQEEEAQRAQQASQINQWLIDQPQPGIDPALLSPSHAPQEPVAAAPAPAPPETPFYQEPQFQQASAHTVQSQAQDLHTLGAQHHAPVPPANDLASMLLNQMQPPQPAAAPTTPTPHEHTRPPMVEQPPQHMPLAQTAPLHQTPPVHHNPVPQQHAPQPQHHQAAPPSVEQPVRAEPQAHGIIEKTVRFANAMMQKISDYFEAKLPPSVLKEVQNIGVQMAQHGIKEAPIPTGPEMGGPAQAPARGPEQQPQIQRG